jgi:hypothetical protein
MAGWRHPAGVTERQLDESAFVHVDGSDEVVVLNSTALTVWDLAVGARDVDDLVQQVAAHHAVPIEQVADDVRRTLDQLVASGLLLT